MAQGGKVGNKGFADLIGAASGQGASRPPPRAGILAARENRLAELASGTMVTRVHEAVDPAICRIWDGHNRDYAALNASTCADLIQGLHAQGRQEVPAIVRRVTDDPKYRYEVICGARRHFAVSWLRAHDYPDFRFLIEPRELTDEEAFRVADLENRHRKDLSDWERATDYARAIDRYYGGNQQRMVERLDVTKSWLSRYLELARLPEEVLAAFASRHVIGISHAATLAPLLRAPRTRPAVLEQATLIAAEQALLAEHGRPPIGAAAVVRRLAIATKSRPARPKPTQVTVRDANGVTVASGVRSAAGGLAITLAPAAAKDRAAIMAAVGELVDRMTDGPQQ